MKKIYYFFFLLFLLGNMFSACCNKQTAVSINSKVVVSLDTLNGVGYADFLCNEDTICSFKVGNLRAKVGEQLRIEAKDYEKTTQLKAFLTINGNEPVSIESCPYSYLYPIETKGEYKLKIDVSYHYDYAEGIGETFFKFEVKE